MLKRPLKRRQKESDLCPILSEPMSLSSRRLATRLPTQALFSHTSLPLVVGGILRQADRGLFQQQLDFASRRLLASRRWFLARTLTVSTPLLLSWGAAFFRVTSAPPLFMGGFLRTSASPPHHQLPISGAPLPCLGSLLLSQRSSMVRFGLSHLMGGLFVHLMGGFLMHLHLWLRRSLRRLLRCVLCLMRTSQVLPHPI